MRKRQWRRRRSSRAIGIGNKCPSRRPIPTPPHPSEHPKRKGTILYQVQTLAREIPGGQRVPKKKVTYLDYPSHFLMTVHIANEISL